MLTQIFKLLFDASAVDRGLAAVDKAARKVGSSVASELTGRIAGAFAVGSVIDTLTNFTGAVIDNADALDEMSDLMNMSIEDIQRLQVAANLAGVPLKKMKGILDGISALQQQAETGDKRAVGLFAGLGIDPSKATALEIMTRAAEAAKGTREAAAAADLFGRRMNDVAATVRALKELGPIEMVSSDQAKVLAKAKDDLEAAKRAVFVKATPAVAGAVKTASVLLESETQRSMFERVALGNTGLFGRLALRIMRGEKPTDATEQGVARPSTPMEQNAMARAAIPLGIAGDSLSRIGLFVGGRGGASERLVSIASSQLAAARTTNRLLAEMRDNQ